jgi:rod shape determining protein RodA
MIDERRLSAHLDWPLIAAMFTLTMIGLAMIYSVKFETQPGVFWTQVKALPIAMLAMVVCLSIDYRTLAQRSLIFYVLLILGLVAVALIGVKRNGSQRWIALPGFSLQPSEFARLVIALMLAMIYGDKARRGRSIFDWTIGAIVVAVPAFLIFRQPDFGTTLTLVAVFIGVVFVAGLPLRTLTIIAVVGLLLSPVAYKYLLHDYQRQRIATFFDPGKDAKGKGYQQMQAKIAVGSGGLTGKGFGQGTQGGYGFLPVAHNDFVFSVLAEEHGFIGVLVALSLYLFVILRSLEAAKLARDRVGAFLVVAIMSGFMVQVMYNITMSAGLAPVKGITLPLMSYGGSSLVATYAAFGLILNVRMRRFAN